MSAVRRRRRMEQATDNLYAKQARRVIGFLFGLRKESPVLTAGMIITMVIGSAASSAVAPIFVSKLLAQIARGTANLHTSSDLLLGYVISLVIGEIITIRITIALAYYA